MNMFSKKDLGRAKLAETNEGVHSDQNEKGQSINLKLKTMKKTIQFAFMMVFVMTTIFFAGCKKENQFNDNDSSLYLVNISFANKVNNDLLQKIVDMPSANLQTINFSFEDGNGNLLNDGGGKSFDDGENIIISNVEQSLKDDYNQIDVFLSKQRLEKEYNLTEQELKDLLKEQQDWKSIKSNFTDIVFTDITIWLDNNDYQEILKLDNLVVKKIDTKKVKKDVLQEKDSYNWTPDQGYVSIGTYSTTKRAVYNQFQWNVKPFSAYGYTYEHDFFLNNYSSSALGAGTYLARNTNSSGFPVCTWYSNMPNKYLDTRLFDENSFQGTSNEVPYTIGCGEGYNLQKDFSYYSHIIVNNGDVNTDNAKLNAQAGEQIPIGCTSVWCSFSAQQKTIVSSWNIAVPGTHAWSLG